MSRAVQKAKDQFFTSDKVKKMLSPGVIKALSKAGAYTRRAAKSSLRYRKSSSAVGQPPSVHRIMKQNRKDKKTGLMKQQQVSPLRELLFFGYDSTTQSVVVGPVITGGKRPTTDGPVPRALERGGRIYKITKVNVSRSPRVISARQREAFLRKKAAGTLPVPRRPPMERKIVEPRTLFPRPFMVPALEKILPQFRGAFKDIGLRV